MKKLNRFLQPYCILICLITFLVPAVSQPQSDTAAYPPQINLVSQNNFTPFPNDSLIETYIWVTDLPPETFQVDFRFNDIHNVQIGESFTTTGTNLTRADWWPFYWRPKLPLSTRFQLVVHWSTDSVAVWNVPFNNLPDTLLIEATQGLGPFISSQYPLNDSLQWNNPWLENTITLRNLPPRTTRVIYKFLGADSAVIDSVKIDATPFHYLDSAQLFNKHMEYFPLSVRYMLPVAYCEGGPVQGVDILRRFTMIPQRPKLFCSNHGTTYLDSIPTIRHKQNNGQVLLVDSVKHGMTTNRPYGGSNTIGICSFDVPDDNFTLETWIHPNVDMIKHTAKGSMTFMRADSAWWVSLVKNGDSLNLVLYIVLSQYEFIRHDTCKLFTAALDTSRFFDGYWHHVAFVRNPPDPYSASFFLDGEPIATNVDLAEFNKINDPNLSSYSNQVKATPILFGGCNVLKGGNSYDRSFIDKMDEIRIWGRDLAKEEIRSTMYIPVQQEYSLFGYWNFNDLNNRLNYIDDISFFNNAGALYNRALLEAGDPMGSAMDSLFLVSSNKQTDSIRFAFHDVDNRVIDSITISTPDSIAEARWVYDLASLPEAVHLLRVHEYYPEEHDTGFITEYTVRITPSCPLATTRNGWGMYYHNSPEGSGSLPSGEGHLYNAVTVTGLPDNTWKAQLGLLSEGGESDIIAFSASSTPYNHSLAFNGSSNFIQTQLKTIAPQQFTLSLWFKTSSSQGGVLAMFSDNLNVGSQTRMNHLLAVKEDGSMLFNILPLDTSTTLHATSQYNDGAWHHVAVTVPPYGVGKARMFVDGTMVDEKQVEGTLNYEGYWLFGRCFDTIPAIQKDTVNGYFQGSMAEIVLWNTQLDYHRINQIMYLPSLDTCQGLVSYYPLNEGSGTFVHDLKGINNGFLMGTTPKWFNDRNLSYIIWNKDMSALDAGMYTFFIRVFFPAAPDTGMVYPLGRFWVEDPVPGYHFSYNISNGLGYFNMADSLVNNIDVWSDFQRPGAEKYYFRYFFLTPDSIILKTETFEYQYPPLNYSFNINTGLAPEGSYLEMIIFYDSMAVNKIAEWMYLPILIRPMVPPKVYGSFGPFLQAIAPGTMKDDNTYIIKTPVVDEMNAVKARFYNNKGMMIGFTDAIRINNETWKVVYDMASLSPPFTAMNLEFYLVGESFPAAVYGPYDIAITRTRPLWFDFIQNSDFKDIDEDSTTVTFGISTTIEDQSTFDNSVHFEVPDAVPLLGGLQCHLFAPTIETFLSFDKKQLKLSIDTLHHSTEFKQSLYHLGVGKESAMSFTFENEGFNTYDLDSNNNLFTTQNRIISGNLSGRFKKITEICESIKTIIEIAGGADPASLLVSPEFSINFNEAFQYSTRLHLMMDTVQHLNAWGSYGNLKVDSREGTPENEESASYHFYGATFGIMFEVGVKALVGLVSAGFSTDLSFNLGFGHSYITVPKTKTRFLKDFHIDISGKMEVKELWGVFEQVIWGPKLFYSKRFWGDDFTDLFSSGEKAGTIGNPIPSNSSDPEIAGELFAVSPLVKTPLAYPQASITPSADYDLFTWLEPGKKPGERIMRSRFLNNQTKIFSGRLTIHSNDQVMNNPVSAGFSDSTVLVSWTQSRMNGLTLQSVKAGNMLRLFAESQDIWYAVFDITKDSIIQISVVGDTTKAPSSGTGQAHPCLAVLSESLALIVWQVADLNTQTSDLWYATLTKQGTRWISSSPQMILQTEGVETELYLASPRENMAVLTFLNNLPPDEATDLIMTMTFQDDQWSAPTTLFEDPAYYINYMSMQFNGEAGAVAFTSYVTDTVNGNYETLSVLPWDASSNTWNTGAKRNLMADSVHHLQYPTFSINGDGSTAIVVKLEQFIPRLSDVRISQVDLFTGNVNDPVNPWQHFPANKYVCDTSKQVSELHISYVGTDTLMLLSQEYPMTVANTKYIPVNGQTWGDPYMNQVLRCFSIFNDTIIEDVPESHYNPGIPEPGAYDPGVMLFQNYPNPCSTQTTIGVELPGQNHILLELFDIKGKYIARLADKTLTAGTYTIQVNTSLLDPGTYLFRLTANNSVQTRRMVVIR